MEYIIIKAEINGQDKRKNQSILINIRAISSFLFKSEKLKILLKSGGNLNIKQDD